ncbi:VCBS repeat-containing protein, partial [bacterium]|nr:VCBS repeat-containing protein [bacterium]
MSFPMSVFPKRQFNLLTSLCLFMIPCCAQLEPSRAAEPQEISVVEQNQTQNKSKTGTDTSQAIQQSRLADRTPSSGPLFTPLSADESGIDFVNPIDITHNRKRLYHSGFVCGGVAVGDLNGDGKPDLFLNSGPRPNCLYLQDDNLRFTDATKAAGLNLKEFDWSTGVTMADVNGDAHLDLLICNYDSPNRLYINDGKANFTEATDSGLEIADASLASSFADYDNDGDLDCFLLTNRFYRAGGRPVENPTEMINGVPVVLDKYKKYYFVTKASGNHYNVEEYGRPDRLFRNNGDGTFEDVTQKSGISGNGHGLSSIWWDHDSDGLIDLYICNDFNDPDYLWRNNGDGTFTNVIANSVPHSSWFSMGSDIADVNNDGLLDLFTVDMSATNHFNQKTTMGVMNAKKIQEVAGPPQQTMRNSLLLNSGTGRFLEAAYLAGVADSDWSWSPKFADYDCDGRVDLFISNGMARNFTNSDLKFTEKDKVGKTAWEFYENTPPKRDRNLAFQNVADLEFKDVSKAWGIDHLGMSYSTALGDLDGDGDVELIVANLDEPVM